MMPDLIFVYGTLKRGYDHLMARRLADEADWIGPATCRGSLYLLGAYPGLVLSPDEGGFVHGDLYALRGDANLLAALDDYEGCGTSDPEPHPYLRATIDVMMPGGPVTQAWTYVYRRPIDGLPLIASGRFA